MQEVASIGIDIECAEEDGGVLITCSGDAGFEQAEALRRVLFRVAARRPNRVRLDLWNLPFISSLTLGVLVTFRRAVERHGGRVTFTTRSLLPMPLR